MPHLPESLREKQTRFARALPRLIDHAFKLGFLVTMGQTKRTEAEATANAARGAGISNSLHTLALAVDLNLFRPDGSYITGDEGHRYLGEFWKALSPDHYWGGDFKKKDFNHYSLSPDGGKTR